MVDEAPVAVTPVPPVAPAAPAAAATTPTTPTDILRSMSAADRASYEATGELPDAIKPTFAEDSSSSKPAAQAASTDATPPPASESGKGKNAETRKAELQAEIDGLLKQRADLRRETAPRPLASVAAPPPAAVDLGPKPDGTDYTKYPLGTADPQFLEDLARHTAKSMLAEERAAHTAAAAKTQAQTDNQRIASEWKTKVETVKAKHADVIEKFSQPINIPAGSAMDAWILESEMGPETLYHLYDHPDEVTRILALSPVRQLEAMVLLGHSLQSDAPPVKTKTDAPPPVPTLDTRPAAAANDAEAALARGDFAAYTRIQNELDLAKSGIRSRK